MEELKRASRGYPSLSTDSARSMTAELEAISGRIRAARTRPLDRVMIGELTSLRFSATRLSRRLGMLADLETPLCDVQLFDPTRTLIGELGDVRAEAARRGVLISLRLQELDRLSRNVNFIDSLASLVEDGMYRGADYLSLETRHTADKAELCLTTDAVLEGEPGDSLGLGVLRLLVASALVIHPYVLVVDSIECGLTRVSISRSSRRQSMSSNHGARRWLPNPSRV